MAEIDLSSIELSTMEILLRFACAMLIGTLIGMEREFTHRPAGLRTHMLVALGACTVMLTSQLLFCQYRPYGSNADPARLSAQVIASVGFLGAGTILREGTTVKGLTTAASIWAVACLGIATGAGYYTVGIVGTCCILMTLTIFEWFQNIFFKNRFNQYIVTIKCHNIVFAMEKIADLISNQNAKISSIQIEDEGEGISAIIFHVDFSGRHANNRYDTFVKDLTDEDDFISVSSEKKTK